MNKISVLIKNSRKNQETYKNNHLLRPKSPVVRSQISKYRGSRYSWTSPLIFRIYRQKHIQPGNCRKWDVLPNFHKTIQMLRRRKMFSCRRVKRRIFRKLKRNKKKGVFKVMLKKKSLKKKREKRRTTICHKKFKVFFKIKRKPFKKIQKHLKLLKSIRNWRKRRYFFGRRRRIRHTLLSRRKDRRRVLSRFIKKPGYTSFSFITKQRFFWLKQKMVVKKGVASSYLLLNNLTKKINFQRSFKFGKQIVLKKLNKSRVNKRKAFIRPFLFVTNRRKNVSSKTNSPVILKVLLKKRSKMKPFAKQIGKTKTNLIKLPIKRVFLNNPFVRNNTRIQPVRQFSTFAMQLIKKRKRFNSKKWKRLRKKKYISIPLLKKQINKKVRRQVTKKKKKQKTLSFVTFFKFRTNNLRKKKFKKLRTNNIIVKHRTLIQKLKKTNPVLLKKFIAVKKHWNRRNKPVIFKRRNLMKNLNRKGSVKIYLRDFVQKHIRPWEKMRRPLYWRWDRKKLKWRGIPYKTRNRYYRFPAFVKHYRFKRRHKPRPSKTKWFFYDIYPYRMYRHIHQPYRIRRPWQLKKLNWWRRLNLGRERKRLINPKKRIIKRLMYFKLFSKHYGPFTKSELLQQNQALFRITPVKSSQMAFALSWYERRLDVVLTRLHLVPSIEVGRILMERGYIFVNGQQIVSPEYRINPWDLVAVVPDRKYYYYYLGYWDIRKQYKNYLFKNKANRALYVHPKKLSHPFGFLTKLAKPLYLPPRDRIKGVEFNRLLLWNSFV